MSREINLIEQQVPVKGKLVTAYTLGIALDDTDDDFAGLKNREKYTKDMVRYNIPDSLLAVLFDITPTTLRKHLLKNISKQHYFGVGLLLEDNRKSRFTAFVNKEAGEIALNNLDELIEQVSKGESVKRII